MKLLRLAPIACAMAVLSGCGTMTKINHDSLEDHASTKARVEQTQAMAKAAVTKPAEPIMSDLPYVNTQPVERQGSLPKSFDEHAGVNFPRSSVWVLMQSLQTVSGMKVRCDDDLLNVPVTPNGQLPPPPTGTVDATLVTSGSPLVVGTNRASIDAISYDGDKKGLFRLIANHLDATFDYDEATNTLHFYRYETRQFHIATLPGDVDNDATVASGTGANFEGATGQSIRANDTKTNTKIAGKLEVWASLEKNLRQVMSSAGSLTINQGTSSIIVRDRWDRVDQVAALVKKANRSMNTQVQVQVAVYRIHDTDGDNRGFNLNVLWNTLGQMAGNAGVKFSTPRPTGDGLSSLIVNTPTQRADGSIPPFAGTQFFLDALSTLGKTSVETTSTVYTVNNMPAPVKVVQTTSYVAQTTPLYTSNVNSGNSGTVGAGATLTPGQVETGFTMQVLPSVQPDGRRMLLQAMISISTLDALTSYSSGGQSIQLPQVSAREFMPRVWMKSGQSLVLAGFESVQADNTIQTPFGEHTWALAGNRTVNRNHDSLVIVITPTASAPQAFLD